MISIHAPIVGCDVNADFTIFPNIISIHAPIVGCDTFANVLIIVGIFISIHAPIVGCDDDKGDLKKWLNDFNPRTHRGVRHTRI